MGSQNEKCGIIDISNIDEDLTLGPEGENELRIKLRNELMEKFHLDEVRANRWVELVISVSESPYNTPYYQIVEKLKEKFPYLKHSR